jgi:hypothetical protein
MAIVSCSRSHARALLRELLRVVLLHIKYYTSEGWCAVSKLFVSVYSPFP